MTTSLPPTGGPVFHASRMDDLPGLMEFVDRACRGAGADDDMQFAVRLAVEEAFSNIIKHGYGGQTGPVAITIDADARRLAVTVVDEAPPFDPADAPPADVEASLDEREGGGLGWHLVHQFMDEVAHSPNGVRGNVLVMVKFFPGVNAR